MYTHPPLYRKTVIGYDTEWRGYTAYRAIRARRGAVDVSRYESAYKTKTTRVEKQRYRNILTENVRIHQAAPRTAVVLKQVLSPISSIAL